MQRRGKVASTSASMRMMACLGATGAARLERLAHPFGSGGYRRLQQREGKVLDMLCKGERRRLIMSMVGVATCQIGRAHV